MSTATKLQKRQRRKSKIRKKISGTPEGPRISIYRSLTSIIGQAVDDVKGFTLKAIKSKGKSVKDSTEAGKELGTALKEKGIKKAVFDRNGFLYHGRVKAFADGLREVGIKI